MLSSAVDTLRSGLIVEVPQAQSAVGQWRLRWDPLASLGVPPHVTVLFPFVPASLLDQETVEHLRELFAELDRFPFVLMRTDWFDQDVLWLAPEPAEPFVGLTRAACAAFPSYRPYGGRFGGTIPHLTVADRAPVTEMLAAESIIRSALPVEATADAVTLMAEQPSGTWARHSSFPLRRRTFGSAGGT